MIVGPKPKDILFNPIKLLAFGLGAGLVPRAPGTAGTLITIPLFLLLQPTSLVFYLGVTVGLFMLGIFICGYTARSLGTHDHPGIVWDEVVGFLIAMLPLNAEVFGDQVSGSVWLWLYVGVVTFRGFDIYKPPPCRWIDRHVEGGFGIMLDDVIAALYAALVVGLLALPEALLSASG